ncbi:DUF397 domain-containing protein [Phytohabitans aurantiacus]|jgi:predicted secreted Zn-dependent protease|uniref:DUF397 domain-containing protein n=1 Tax=Phytohabitans aurantiacus TaxID=3016789 RepID=A0ABQ5R1A3_9ACTN|nr:DUF397 domain-containing protein [Phytohabitans aurantiacus]GLI00088.1 hypothetical protein Pa4123_53640 [Phytohabitans aurantiacus]
MAHSGAVSATWRKSTRCESHACVEVARAPEAVAIRNSTLPQEHLSFAVPVWRAFVAGVRAGEFDLR